VLLSIVVVGHLACRSGGDLPERLSDEEFASLSASLSEPAGAFAHSENLVSNELHFPRTIRTFHLLGASGGVYVGVGPEQNFSYIAATRARMAFIVDIRAENRNLHLLYKALFARSLDRAGFLSRLFSRERPPGLGPDATVDELFSRYERVKPSAGRFEATRREVRDELLAIRGLALTAEDFRWIDYVLHAFYTDGPAIRYDRSRDDAVKGPTYRDLMTATDARGRSRSYLAAEDAFAFVRDLHARNLIVPVVGDFSGSDAIRGVGAYVRARGAVVRSFYGSNVSVYLSREQEGAFCANLAGLPFDSRSWFIGANGLQRFRVRLRACSSASRMDRQQTTTVPLRKTIGLPWAATS
jgi:hypothetical protein